MEVKRKNKKLLIVVGVLLLFGGLSLAYFVSSILFNGNGASTKFTTTANIKGATVNVEGILSFEDLDILPGHKSISSIKVTATGNNELIPYNLIWKGTNTLTTPLNFTIYKTSEEINVTATCEKKTKTIGSAKAISEECEISNIDRLGSEIASGTINKNDTKVILAKDAFITATSTGDIKYYYVILEYPNLDEPQNEDLSGEFEGEVTVEESTIQPDINILATYIKQDNGEYKEVEEIPQEGYQLNTSKSTCSNETLPSWDIKNRRFYADNLTTSGTSCYLYFDKIEGITVDNIIAANNPKATTPTFTNVATTDEGVYSVSDPVYGGTSYYWRGAVTNNYVKFANFCWRIVRINGDGSIRLIYDGATCHANGTIASESIVKTNQTYNPNYDRSEYVGWTYSIGSQRTTSGSASNIKVQTEEWYGNAIIGTNAEKVADGKFCNDRNTADGHIWGSQPSNSFYYAGYERLYTNKTPTLSCPSGDVYTMKVGAITADEVAYAGGVVGSANSSYYLYNGKYYWTMSPAYWFYLGSSNRYVQVFYMTTNGTLGPDGAQGVTLGVRPVINLKADTLFTIGGNGTQNNPYVVEGAE